jgi:hypothetical protein
MNSTSQHIVQILETIQSFQIVQCQMHHEKVALDVNDKPIHNVQDDTMIFDRVNLCHKAIRNKRLGCAHSGANLNFEHVLEQLKIALPKCTNQISEFISAIRSTVIKIYTLDHQVGYLEHDIAVCKLNCDTYGKDKLEQSLVVLKANHKEYMSLLFKIKADIEQLIVSEINYSRI